MPNETAGLRRSSLWWLGSIALLGACVTGVSDVLLFWGAYDSGATIALEQIANVAPEDVLLGSWLGVAAIPFWGFGIVPMAAALSPSPRLRALVCGAFAYAVVMFGAVHVLYFSYALAHQPFVPESWLEGVLRLRKYISIITSLSAFGGCFGWIAAVSFRKTNLPRAAALINPLTLAILLFSLSRALPAPAGGMLFVSSASLAFGIFFFLVAILQARTERAS